MALMDIATSTWLHATSVFTSIPAGWMVFFALCVLVSLDALRSGSSRATALALALPLTLFLYQLLPDAPLIGGMLPAASSPLAHVFVIGVMALLFFLLCYRMVDNFASDSSGAFSSVLVGLATSIVVVVVWSLIPPLTQWWDFGESVRAVFGEYRFWMLLVSFIALAFARS